MVDLSDFSEEEMAHILAVVKLMKKLNVPSEDEEEDEYDTAMPKAKRKNLFESSPEFDMHRDDTSVDKKLWQDRQPQPRMVDNHNRVKVKCRKCDKDYMVSTKEVPPDADRFLCDRCIKKGR